MATVQLTEREQLIELILRLSDNQVATLAQFVEQLANDPNWNDEGISAAELARRNQLDQAAIDAVRHEPARPLEDVLHTIEQLEDLEDITVSEARKDEVGIPFDEAIKELGFDPERLETIARDEGWMK